MALHAGGAVGDHLRLRPWITLVVLDRERVRRGQGHLRTTAAVHHDPGRRRAPAGRRALGLGARPRQPERRGHPGRGRHDRPGRGDRPRRRHARPEPRPRLLAPALPAPAGRQHRLPRLRRPDVRDGTAGRARPRPGRAHRSPPRRRGPTTPAARSARSTRSTCAGTSAPARTATSSTWCACSSRRSVDPRVGARDMDVAAPGANLPGITNLGGILRLGGALQVPDLDLDPDQLAERQAFENWDQPFPHPFQTGARRVHRPGRRLRRAERAADANAAVRPRAGVDDDPDPLITAPLYGQWHALTQRLLTNRDGTPAPNQQNWVHRLNLDPRFRVPAGFGSDVVKANQEAYIDDAWQQIGDVLAANHRIRFLHLATEVSTRWFTGHVQPLAAARPERAFALTAPVHSRILGSPTTIAAQRRASLVSAACSPRRRCAGRPVRAPASCGPCRSRPTVRPDNLLTRVNAGEVSAAPPKVVPPGVVTVGQVAGARAERTGRLVAPAAGSRSRGCRGCSSRSASWSSSCSACSARSGSAIGLAVLVGARRVGVAAAGVPATARTACDRHRRGPPDARRGHRPAGQPGLRAHGSRHGYGNARPAPPTAPRRCGSRTRCATSYALVDASRPIGAAPVLLAALDLAALTDTAVAGVNPRATVLQRGFSTIMLPPWIVGQLTEDFGEVMAYPRIDLPMYEPLKAISAELFLPNINLIPPEQHHAGRDQPALHRVLHGRAQPRVRARAAVARVPDRPAGHLLPAVLGRPQRDQHRRAEPGRAARAALRHPRAAPLVADLRARRAQQPRPRAAPSRPRSCS